MSLFKAYNLKRKSKPATFDDLRGDFLDVIANCTDKATRDDVVTMISLYTAFSVRYLEIVSVTLKDPEGASESMKFMNSLIAEAVHMAGLHYYDRERGHSIVDKPIQFALENGGVVTVDYINACIDSIEESYKEDEEELEDEGTN